MNPDTIKSSIQAVVDGLTPLAQKMQVPLSGLWEWALRHNYAQAYFDLIMVVMSIVGIIFVSKLFKWGLKQDKEGNFPGGYMIGGFLLVASLIVGFVCIHQATMRFVAPEWSTAQDISCLIKDCNN